MESLLEFLRNPENRALLTWVGGGIASLSAAFWIVLKFIIERPKIKSADSSKAPTQDNLSVDVSGGIGIGGNAQVHKSFNKIGYSLGALFVVGLILLLIVFVFDKALYPLLRSDGRLPSFELKLVCHSDFQVPTRMNDDEREQFTRLDQLLEASDGQTMYIDLDIRADSGAGGCLRERAMGKRFSNEREMTDDDIKAGNIYFNRRSIKSRPRFDISDVMRNGHEITVFNPEIWPVTGVFLCRGIHSSPRMAFTERGIMVVG
ncbi:hypothetical protein SAMN02799622_06097 [Methylobacterium sp. UNC378MF]|uniref:hypothetical protein n=1 Tax=Methylobacterium sp. UNC378MF TaxID=1502748 RepID=UPI00088C21CC|nr:hypothetical protein [Methylobacterium sp. UNC378MF]SDA35461.1 hypothetical protein SAMN02799622_06097 [Methylobacterium sp. UNC378MF]